MCQAPKVCFDRILPDTIYAPQGATRIALMKAKLWPNNSQLIVQCSRQSTPRQRAKVQETFEELMDYVNLDFRMAKSGEKGDIRVSFLPSQGAWSYIGTDAGGIPKNQPTMNLGFGLDDGNEGTYMHEFCHAIGAIHEHQNPAGGIRWNRDQVIRDLSGPPNYWDLETIEANMFEAYSRNQLNGSELDPDSIMMYAIPSRWTLDGFSTKQNTKLSAKDKEWLAKCYPGRTGVEPAKPIIQLPVFDLTPTGESIGQPGERDLFQVQAKRPGRYRFEVLGETSVVLRVFGPTDPNRLVGQTDNALTPFNASLEVELVSGTYFVQVTHAEPEGTGAYQLLAMLIPPGYRAEPTLNTIWRGPVSAGEYGFVRF